MRACRARHAGSNPARGATLARSSAGQSTRLIRGRPVVRLHPCQRGEVAESGLWHRLGKAAAGIRLLAGSNPALSANEAGVAELADAAGSKPGDRRRSWEFKSPRPHFNSCLRSGPEGSPRSSSSDQEERLREDQEAAGSSPAWTTTGCLRVGAACLCQLTLQRPSSGCFGCSEVSASAVDWYLDAAVGRNGLELGLYERGEADGLNRQLRRRGLRCLRAAREAVFRW